MKFVRKSISIFAENWDEVEEKPFDEKKPVPVLESAQQRAANSASGAWGSNSCIANNYPNEDDSGLGQKESKNPMDSAISYTILM